MPFAPTILQDIKHQLEKYPVSIVGPETQCGFYSLVCTNVSDPATAAQESNWSVNFPSGKRSPLATLKQEIAAHDNRFFPWRWLVRLFTNIEKKRAVATCAQAHMMLIGHTAAQSGLLPPATAGHYSDSAFEKFFTQRHRLSWFSKLYGIMGPIRKLLQQEKKRDKKQHGPAPAQQHATRPLPQQQAKPNSGETPTALVAVDLETDPRQLGTTSGRIVRAQHHLPTGSSPPTTTKSAQGLVVAEIGDEGPVGRLLLVAVEIQTELASWIKELDALKIAMADGMQRPGQFEAMIRKLLETLKTVRNLHPDLLRNHPCPIEATGCFNLFNGLAEQLRKYLEIGLLEEFENIFQTSYEGLKLLQTLCQGPAFKPHCTEYIKQQLQVCQGFYETADYAQVSTMSSQDLMERLSKLEKKVKTLLKEYDDMCAKRLDALEKQRKQYEEYQKVLEAQDTCREEYHERIDARLKKLEQMKIERPLNLEAQNQRVLTQTPSGHYEAMRPIVPPQEEQRQDRSTMPTGVPTSALLERSKRSNSTGTANHFFKEQDQETTPLLHPEKLSPSQPSNPYGSSY